jgi:endoglucanase
MACLPLLVGACDSVPDPPQCGDGTSAVDGKCPEPETISLNMVGFLPERVKLASIPIEFAGFAVVGEDDSVAYQGTASGPEYNADTEQELWFADFTELQEEGRYRLRVEGVGESPPFTIGAEIYGDVLHTAMLGMTGQRCGMAVSFRHLGQSYSHRECHLKDGRLDYAGEEGLKPGVGGWHDAGDYGKYTVNGAFTVGMMLRAWEQFSAVLEDRSFDVPEHGGPLPDYLAEVKWEIDWLLTMQFEDGSVSHKLTRVDFEPDDMMPGLDLAPRYFAPTGTAAAADLVAVAAMAARIYEPYDEDFAEACLDAAELSYMYLTETDPVEPNLAKFETGDYLTRRDIDSDDRFWAAAELWETTGSDAALDDVEGRVVNGSVPINWDWGDLANLGTFTYLLSQREDRDARDSDLVARLQEELTATADQIVENSEKHGYGCGYVGGLYWGSNGIMIRTVMALQVAHALTADDRYLDAAVRQLDFVMGRNYFGRTLVTGVGHAPPLHPHHRPSMASTGSPWPGLLVGGANPHQPNSDERPEALWWADAESDYRTNEIAINWTGALIYALASFAQ